MKASRTIMGALAVALAGCAGAEVRGLVRDARTGEPLPNARVQVGDEEAVTDHAGRFVVDGDDEGLQDVRVFKTGYAPFEGAAPTEGTGDADEATADIPLQRLKQTPEPPTSATYPQHLEPAHAEEWLRVPSHEEQRKGGLEPDARAPWDRQPY